MKKDETPVNQLIRETCVLVKEKKTSEDMKKLEEYGLIKTKGKTRIRMTGYTDRGLKRVLAISLDLETQEKGENE